MLIPEYPNQRVEIQITSHFNYLPELTSWGVPEPSRKLTALVPLRGRPGTFDFQFRPCAPTPKLGAHDAHGAHGAHAGRITPARPPARPVFALDATVAAPWPAPPIAQAQALEAAPARAAPAPAIANTTIAAPWRPGRGTAAIARAAPAGCRGRPARVPKGWAGAVLSERAVHRWRSSRATWP